MYGNSVIIALFIGGLIALYIDMFEDNYGPPGPCRITGPVVVVVVVPNNHMEGG